METSQFIVQQDIKITEAMAVIDKNSQGIVFVCEQDRLIGTVTDGDIRRCILSGRSLQAPVVSIANQNCCTLSPDTAATASKIFTELHYSALPVLDASGRIIDIRLRNQTGSQPLPSLGLPVVIMAGGKGTRLYPYTQILPKPLIPIGEKTITEHIMDKFEGYGCSEFRMIVNYKRNLIKAYFQDDEQMRNVRFYDEQEYYGTGGGLKLLENDIQSTFFMSNCDTLIDVNYADILKQHREQGSLLTMICATKKVTIPYGTIDISETGYVAALKEKPQFTFLTNVGLYVIEPAFLQKIPKNVFVHITDVIQNCIDVGEKIGVFPINENAWMDMGQFEELEQMSARLGVVTK